MVVGNATQSHPDQALGRAQQHVGPAGERMVVDPAGHLHREEPPERRHHAPHGEDGEGRDEGGRLGLGAEELALDDQEDEHGRAHEQGDDVGGVQEVEGERGHEERRPPPATSGAAPSGCRGRA